MAGAADTGGAAQNAVNALTLSGVGLNAFAGVNGPYRSGADLDADGLPDTINTDSIGFTLTDLDFALAVLSDGEREWLAAQARAAEVALVGIDGLDLAARSIELQIMQAAADRSLVDFAALPMDVVAGVSDNVRIALAAADGERLALAADVDLGLGSLMQIEGRLSFEFARGRTLNLDDGQAVSADVLTLTGEGVGTFLGTGADRDDALGFQLGGLDFGLVWAKAADGRFWLSAKGQADSIGLVGAERFDLAAAGSDVTLEINRAFAAPGISASTTALPTIDWTGANELAFGEDDWAVIDFSGDRLQAAGAFNLAIGDAFAASGSLRVEQGRKTVKVGTDNIQVNTLALAGADLDARLSLAAGSGVGAAVGLSGTPKPQNP